MVETTGKSLSDITAQLKEMLAADRKNWAHTYRLMAAVRDQRLYAPNFRSFSQWVRELSRIAKIHESTLWQRLKAGQIYDDYRSTADAETDGTDDENVPALEDADIMPETLELVGKVAGDDKGQRDLLIEKLLAGELDRKALRDAYRMARADRAAQRLATADEDDDADTDASSSAATSGQGQEQEKIVEAQILGIIRYNRDWVYDYYGDRMDERRRYQQLYRVLSEFAVRPGTTHHARRIDALVIESIESGYGDDLKIHNVEIKADKTTLVDDKKMLEYGDFCDCNWVATTSDLADDADSVIPTTWGIIVVDLDDRSITIHRKATYKRGALRERTLSQAIYNICNGR